MHPSLLLLNRPVTRKYYATKAAAENNKNLVENESESNLEQRQAKELL